MEEREYFGRRTLYVRLTNGHVTLVETAKRDEVWRIQGKDIDGDPLIVIARRLEETITIKVVTAFRRSDNLEANSTWPNKTGNPNKSSPSTMLLPSWGSGRSVYDAAIEHIDEDKRT